MEFHVQYSNAALQIAKYVLMEIIVKHVLKDINYKIILVFLNTINVLYKIVFIAIKLAFALNALLAILFYFKFNSKAQ
jgi:hypothetical protein